jgi:hypothetical protein
MAGSNDNPYRPPAEAKKAEIDSAADSLAKWFRYTLTAKRVFRWRYIPAGLSWCVSLLWGLTSIYVLFLFAIEPGLASLFGLSFILCLAAALLVGSILHFFAGRKWVAGKWGTAILSNAASVGVFPGTVFLLQLYRFSS